MIRWLAHAMVKIGLASVVIWFATALFENGLGRTMAMVSNVASGVVASATALDWSVWPAILSVCALAVIGMVIYDTATRD